MKKILEVVGRRRFYFSFSCFHGSGASSGLWSIEKFDIYFKNASLKEVIHELKRLGGYDLCTGMPIWKLLPEGM
ncbi:MAG: hypothetical protein ACLU30_15675 [Odoribacter splanchnicus]